MRSDGWALIQYEWCPYKKRLGYRHIQREDHVKVLGEDGHLQVKERGLGRNQPWWHLDLGLLTSRTVRKHISVVEAAQSVVLYYVSTSKLIHIL